MATPVQTAASMTGRVPMQDREFPKEAFDYDAEVTKEAIDQIKEKAATTINSEEWEIIDGFR
ncbi:hypothetical protein [Roseibium sp.]|uniref:hypothetical protein n=1 Tax=Roseibium sp. TaxID=1936156 RepID=UPI0032654EED